MKIPDLTYEYLRVQHGSVSHIKERGAFEQAYLDSVFGRYQSIAPHLPAKIAKTLDIGGGMSGIGLMVKVNRGFDIEHHVLDGLVDPPVVHKHYRTFSSAEALKKFYRANGGEPVVALATSSKLDSGPYDVILSFTAWCFHFPPSEYIERVSKVFTKGTMVLDVRRNKPEWQRELFDAFGPSEVIYELPKLERHVWKK